ncbi:basement membrane-specific heparan sulfate proteoglycan core protein-like [Watersipora subatra]|uniref:basement membrane-specific heparan sulfate proteoglycan core protein-like n=1 Tax=Watersipora subatra TaxID=2589382 RepID=UPI00355C02A8
MDMDCVLPYDVGNRGATITFGPVSTSQAGYYYCFVSGYPQYAETAELVVDKPASCTVLEFRCGNGNCVFRGDLCNGQNDCGDNSDENNCQSSPDQCEPPEMKCNNGRCVQKIWRCDGDDDCKDGTDEQRQYCTAKPFGDPCELHEHQCSSRDQCVPKSYICDGQTDCLDNSDEIGCSMPTVTIPLRPTLTVTVGDTFTLTCTAIGYPVPLISWRLNWGNIPTGSRVTETSVNGKGVLIIRNVQESDAGAYTCEAINNQNSIFGTPDTIVTVDPGEIIDDYCSRGTFNKAATRQEDCLTCYCSGVGTGCDSTDMNMYRYTIDEGVTLADERASELPSNLYSYDPRYRQYTIPNYRDTPPNNLYWRLPDAVRGNQLMSYGGTLRYSIEYNAPDGRLNSAYDVIIFGSSLVVYCRSAARYIPNRVMLVQVQLMERDCESMRISSNSDFPIPETVTRAEFMEVLIDVQDMLIRATYNSDQYSTSIREISIEKATPQVSGSQAVMVEHCDCQRGYVGMSCEDCDNGFERRGPTSQYPRGECVPIITTPPPCNSYGTLRIDNGRCVCKLFANGTYCDQCLANTFHLNRLTEGGCIECFCMGVTKDCTSTSRRREVVSVSSYYSSNDWSLAEDDGQTLSSPNAVISASGNEMIADLRSMGSETYFWKLPSQFNGNKLGAYGGTLRFTIKFISPYVDRPTSEPDIIIIGGYGIRMYSPFVGINLDTREYSAEIPMLANNWRRSDNAPFTREHLLMALADVQAILIKATVTVDTEEAWILDVSLDVASERAAFGNPIAYEVEECNCPAGYEGMSCETCSPGYTKSAGVYLDICTRCDCNGHADECDSDTGACIACAHGTAGDSCQVCDTGYVRNANDNSPYDCINPRTMVTISEPTITVTIGGRAELICSPYSSDLPYSEIIWRRTDGRPIPSTATYISPGRLMFSRVQVNDEGQYECSITTVGGVVGTGIASIVIINPQPCPTGYTNYPVCNVCADGYYFNSARVCVERSQILVTVSPTSLTVNEGEDIRLYCTARSQVDNAGYLVVWRREDGGLPTKARDTNGDLYIPQATLNDAAIYICTGSNQFEQRSERVVVRVLRATLPTDLTVRIEPNRLYVAEGRSGSIRCMVTGNARSVSWRRPRDVPILDKNQISTTMIRDDTLTFVNMAVNDRGYYYCTAIGADSVTRVDSREPAVVDIERNFISIPTPDVRVTAGDNARLECRADSSVAAVSIQWSRDAGSMDNRFRQSSGILDIIPVEERDDGTYTCTIRTSTGAVQTGSARLTVYPRVPQPENIEAVIDGVSDDSITFTIGSPIRLRCSLINAVGPYETYWQYGGSRNALPDNAQIYDGIMYIPSARGDNAGRYTCTGVSGNVFYTRDVYLLISSRIVINLPDKYDAPLNTDVDLTCKVPLSPGAVQPVVYWVNGKGQRLTQSQYNEATLSIVNVQMSNAGNYTCIVEVDGASTSKTLRLNVIPNSNGLLYWAQNPLTFNSRPGAQVSLDCQPETSQQVVMVWRRDNYPSLPAGAVQRGSMLEFRSVLTSDAGTYTCTATNAFGSSELYATLMVQGPPGRPVVSANGDRMEPDGVKTYNSGDQVVLSCIADGSPSPQYRWSKTNAYGGFVELQSGGNIQINDGILNGQGSQLIIGNVRMADEGYYNCTAYNSLGSSYVYTRLIVRSGYAVPANVNIIGGGDGPLRNMYNIGETAILRCQASSVTAMTYRWTFSGGVLPSNAVTRSAVLEIRELDGRNQGTYYCVVMNAAGSSSPAAHQVIVSDSSGGQADRTPVVPIAARTEYRADVGDLVRLQCSLPANADSIQWIRENGLPLPSSARLSSRNQLLELVDVSLGDAGVYYCYATNSVGSSPYVALDVIISSELAKEIGPQSYDIEENGQVTLQCNAPDAAIDSIWSREGNKSLPGQYYFENDLLIIPRIKVQDGGIYYCTAQFANGKTQTTSAIVNVVAQPDSRPSLSLVPGVAALQRVREGATVDIRCVASDSDALITWARQDGKPLSSNARQINGETLRISDIKPDDAGVYLCRATNGYGVSEPLLHTIEVGSAPRPLTLQIMAEGVLADANQPNTYKEASQLSLDCTASDDQATVVWSRIGEVMPYGVQQYGNVLVFASLEERDRGTYRCVASLSGSRVYGDYAFDVIYKPSGNLVSNVSITVQPNNYVSEGGSVTLQCSAKGDGIYYEWTKDNGPISPEAVVRNEYLGITDFNIEDVGEYTCTASNNYGPSKTASTRLALRVSLYTPSLTINGEQRYGETVTIECSTVDNEANLSIRKDGLILAQSPFPGGDVEYRVGPITVGDLGTYQCLATQDTATNTDTIELTIPGPPPPPYVAIQPPQADVPEGSTFQFKCQTPDDLTLSAMASYNWTKDEYDIPDHVEVTGNTLTFTNTSEIDEGNYTCIAYNENGEAQATAVLTLQVAGNSTVTYANVNKTTGSPEYDETTLNDFLTTQVFSGPPMIATPCEGIRTGGDACLVAVELDQVEVSIDCTAVGSQGIKYEWRQQGNDTVISSDPVLKLTAESDLSSVYICEASNEFGSESDSWQVAKNAYLPTFVSADSYYTLPGIPDAYSSTTFGISFTPQDDSGLLLYAGAENEEDQGRDAIALGLVEGTPVLKINLGSGLKEVASAQKVTLNQPNMVEVARNKNYIKMMVNDEVTESTLEGSYVGLSLGEAAYVSGVPEAVSGDQVGFGKSYQGVINSLEIQGKPVQFDMKTAMDQGILPSNSCLPVQCQNFGVCVSATNMQGYDCICPKGYSGSLCSTEGIDCYPGYCLNNGECLDTGTGPSCKCGLAYEGDKCETESKIETPQLDGEGYLRYPPLEGVSRTTTIKLEMRAGDESNGLLAYAGENEFGSGDYMALLIRNGSVVFTFDLGEGPAVIEGNVKVEPGVWHAVEAERTEMEGSLIIDGGVAVKDSVQRASTTTTTEEPRGWFWIPRANNAEDVPDEEPSSGSNVGLDVKTPLFLGGVSADYSLPGTLNVSGFTGCIRKMEVGSIALDLIADSTDYGNISSCPDLSIMNDDPCQKLPCLNYGTCLSVSTSEFTCVCPKGYMGEFCAEKRTACSVDKPCKNGGLCEPVGADDFKCRCLVGWTGETCDTSEASQDLAYANGVKDSVALPQFSPDDFSISSSLLSKAADSSAVSGSSRSSFGSPRFGDATRPNDYFKQLFQRLKGARDKTILSGKKACFSGTGYLELPRQILPSSSPEMKVQLTVATRSKEGLLYWQGQQSALSGAGRDFFGIGLVNGYVKFSFELGGGPAVIMSTIRVNDGSSHVIEAKRNGQQGLLIVDGLPKVIGSSSGPLKHLNGNGNIYIGGVPHYKRMVSSNFSPGFDGCISHMKTSGTKGVIDLFAQRITGVDVTNE